MKKAKIEKAEITIHPSNTVTVTTAGNVTTVRYAQKEARPAILKINKDVYIKYSDFGTNKQGEAYDFNHTTTRAENIKNVRASLAKLRDLINANANEPENILWITLTYRENMTDTKRLYNDFKKFNMRLHTYCQQNNLPHFEYLICAEPQARGAWHIHGLLIFPQKVYIPKPDLERVWGHGFVSIKRPDRADNLGLYLTAYLCDMELSQVPDISKIDPDNIKVVNGDDGKTKAVIKGERLKLYTVGFRIFRASKGIKRPIVEEMSYKEAIKKLSSHTLVYEKGVKLLNDDSDKLINLFKYEQYVRRVNKRFRGKRSETE